MQEEKTLVLTLNALLTSLEIPLVLESPLDLTPSLILAILESMLKTRLPISSETRKSATHRARVEAMKVFIGVLEDDVLGVDVGLDEIDPRRLADGKREEVMHIAEVLCWFGKKMNYVSVDGLCIGNLAQSRDVTDGNIDTNAPPSPSLHSTASLSLESSLLMHSTRSFAESQTTMSSHDASEDVALLDDPSALFTHPRHHRTMDIPENFHANPGPSRICDLDDFPSLLPRRRRGSLRLHEEAGSAEDNYVDESFCHCPPDMSACSTVIPHIRTTGYMKRMSLDDELKSYEKWRDETAIVTSRSPSYTHNVSSKPRLPVVQFRTPSRMAVQDSSGIVTRHTSPSQHTLALLEERARLLSELSKFKRGRG